ncbi:MAG: polyphosphate polymerase domain-containing protein [Verrucomicrobiota bacterium]
MVTRPQKTRFQPGPSRKQSKDQLIERFEQKYVVHPSVVPQIREFIRPFCIPDPNGRGEIPEYTVTTMQLDTAGSSLALAKERKAFSRFKLRIRTYGTEGAPSDPVFFEIKRKVGGVIVKSRAKMVRAQYDAEMFECASAVPRLSTPKDNTNLIDFLRLRRQVGALPKILVRYIRESYFGENDDYARVTFDRRISYRPTDLWDLPTSGSERSKRWRAMDTQTGLKTGFAGYVFELKAMRDAPTWMLELIERFDLNSIGFSKYATAHRLESLYSQSEYTCAGENVTQSW